MRFLPFHVKFLSIFFSEKVSNISILIEFHNYIQVIFEKIKLERNLLYCPQKFFKILYNKVVFPLKNMHIFVLFATKKEQRQNKKRFE